MPEALRHVLALLFKVSTFSNVNGFEVVFPHFLDEDFVGGECFGFEFVLFGEVGILVEADLLGGLEVVEEAVVAQGVVDDPFLVGKAVFKVGDGDGQDVAGWFNGSEVDVVLCFLEADELDGEAAFFTNFFTELAQ